MRFGLSAIGQPQWLMIATIGLHGFAFGFFFVVAQVIAWVVFDQKPDRFVAIGGSLIVPSASALHTRCARSESRAPPGFAHAIGSGSPFAQRRWKGGLRSSSPARRRARFT